MRHHVHVFKAMLISILGIFLAGFLLSGVAIAERQSATGSIGVPQPATTWYLAEGSTGPGFETWILVQNPGSTAVHVTLTYQTGNGEVPGPAINLAPKTRKSVNVGETVQTYSVSTVVSADKPVVAERAVYFNNRVAATDSIGTSTPQKNWYLAEGSTGPGFETWILVQNPGGTSANVTFTYLTDTGEVAGPTLSLAPKTRDTVNVGNTVQTYNVSTVVSSDQPVVAERAVYSNNRSCATDSIGVSEPKMIWCMAEGATTGGFETWILVQNPGNTIARATITYLTDVGVKWGPTLNMAPRSRQSVNVADTVQTYNVSTVVNADQPVVAERAVYFNNRTCGSDSIGASNLQTTWYLAEGSTGPCFETWVLVANPNTTAANVTLSYQTDTGEVAGPTLNLPALSRLSVNVADTVQTYNVSTVVTSDKPVVAERSVYYDPAWQPPDVEKVVFARDGNIWIMNLDGSNQKQLTSSGFDDHPVISPDGKLVAFDTKFYDHLPDNYYASAYVASVYVMNADGSNLRRITTSDMGTCREPYFFSDSDRVVFCRETAHAGHERYQLSTVSLSSGAIRDIDEYEGDPSVEKFQYPVASLDGGFVYSGLQGSEVTAGYIERTNVSNGGTATLVPRDSGGSQYHGYYLPALSKDGKTLAMCRDGASATATLPAQLALRDANGGNKRVYQMPSLRLYAESDSDYFRSSWTSDGRLVVSGTGYYDGFGLFGLGREGNIYILDSQGNLQGQIAERGTSVYCGKIKKYLE